MSKPLMPNVNDKFDSLEAFEDAARLAAKYEGFAFSRKDSNLTGCKGKSLFVVLQCTKGGEWKNCWNITEETSKRKKTTKREGCPVYIRATATKCHSTTSVLNTEVKWIVTKAVLEHKHTMLELDEVATFPQYRAMSLNQKNLVQQLHDNNAPTRVITAAVNKVINGGIILSKDIVNERARIRLALNEGYNNDSTQILLRLLEERDYMVVAHKTTKGYLTHLFFSHVEAAKCVAKCPEVLIKGVLASYQIAMAWIDNESEASYTWFLQTLRTKIYNAYGCLPDVFMSDRDQALRNASSKVFPESNKMLCVWHLLEQNLKVNCRKLFKNDEDYEMFKKEVEALRFSECEEEIPQSLNAIKKAAEKSHSPEKVESYIQTWMKDSKLWILAYTKQFCHMGISTTGRSESSHSIFKRAIETASDLESVFRQIDQVMRLQHLKSAIRMGSNKVAIDPFTLRNPIFSELIGKVSTWAINQIKKTIQKKKDTDNNIEDYIIELPRPSKSAIIDSEFYTTFVNAEEKFQQLPDNIAKNEFITKIQQVMNEPLSEPIKFLPKKVSKSSTKRGSLLSEKQDAAAKKKKKMLDSIMKPKNKTVQQQKIPLNQTSITSQSSSYKLYEANLPKFMREHVSAYFNSHYIQLFLEKEKEYNDILFTTQWEAGSCGKEHWMSMPSFGYVIANTFQRPVHYFSKYISLTFLPDNTPLNRNISIAFIYVLESQHFVAIKLKPNVPVPPIANGWEKICAKSCKIWENLFLERIARFKKEYEDEYRYLQKVQLKFKY
ncbi:23313_t:CDS:2 [Dentiscutata erythropus]|uniref:23313_t:CDS:1 n=1 Tax=Dentiscutata erythropus TaxID=1348616 RepID=A0A9N9P3A2_9GLOM|nr:23313_t:CDS:2 [Dentiscutata erythropus]